jgi:hypothetical protein
MGEAPGISMPTTFPGTEAGKAKCTLLTMSKKRIDEYHVGNAKQNR